jgi:hypothetical protein
MPRLNGNEKNELNFKNKLKIILENIDNFENFTYTEHNKFREELIKLYLIFEKKVVDKESTPILYEFYKLNKTIEDYYDEIVVLMPYQLSQKYKDMIEKFKRLRNTKALINDNDD